MDAEHLVVTEEAVNAEIIQLVEANRLRCLWFLRPDYLPGSTSERITTLGYLAKYGDRATFISARRLTDWLLQNFKELSAE